MPLPTAGNGLPALATVADLRQLLGIASARQLWFFVRAEARSYHAFDIPKASGGTRTIHAPVPSLKRAQRRLLDEILTKVPAHPAAHGYVPGRSTLTNAAAHAGRRVVAKFDLQDFFPTVTYPRVVGLFKALGYPAGPDLAFSTRDESVAVAQTLARLCCRGAKAKARWQLLALPQGAPTSPAVTNIICRRFDARLTGYAAKVGAAYTRYADDLTFSFAADRAPVKSLRAAVAAVAKDEGFTPHPEKFRLSRSGRRQTVTGLVVNAKPALPRETRRRLRAIVHNCFVRGVDHEAAGDPGFRPWLTGMLAYAWMVMSGPKAPAAPTPEVTSGSDEPGQEVPQEDPAEDPAAEAGGRADP